MNKENVPKKDYMRIKNIPNSNNPAQIIDRSKL